MTSVLPLIYIARDVCVQILIGRREENDNNQLLSMLSTDHFTPVSELILNRIVDLYPKRLTGMILCCIPPPHLKRLNLKKCDKVKSTALKQALQRSVGNIHILDLSECGESLLESGPFTGYCAYIPHLTSLNVENTYINDDAIQAVLKHLHGLKHLGLSSCNEVTDSAFLINEELQLFQERQKFVPKMLSSLTSVDVSACQKITSMGIRNLVTLCGPTLQNLDVSWSRVDCMSFWYLGGYSFNSAVFLAMNVGKLQGHSFTEILQECGDVMNKCTGFAEVDNVNYQTETIVVGDEPSNAVLSHDNWSFGAVGEFEPQNASSEDIPAHKVKQTDSPFLPDWAGSNSQSTLQLMLEDMKLTDFETNMLPSQENSQDDVCVVDVESVHLFDSPSVSSLREGASSDIKTVVEDKCDNLAKDQTLLSSGNSAITCDNLDTDDAVVKKASVISSTSEINQNLPRAKLKWYEPCLISLNANSMDYSHENLNVLCFKAFFLANPELKRLTLSWKDLSDAMLEYIGKCCTKLTDLSLLDCESVTSTGVISLGNHCRELEALNLRGVLHADNHMAVLPLLTNKLQRLDLSECDVTDPVLGCIARNCAETLNHLDLSWCEEVTESGLLQVVDKCDSLETLILHQCEVTERVIESISSHCLNITKLSLFMVSGITDTAVDLFASSLSKLYELDLSWNDTLTDASVTAVLVKCLEMKQLCLAGLKQMTSGPLIPIIGDLPQWRRFQTLLKLKKCEQQLLNEDEHYSSSDEEYDNLYLAHRSTSYAVNLRFLNLNYCDRVDDSQLEEIVYCCAGSLRIIDYYGYDVEPSGIPVS